MSLLRLGWYALCLVLGAVEGILAAEIVGLILLPPTLFVLVRVSRRAFATTPTLLAFAAGFEAVAVLLTVSVLFPTQFFGTLNNKLFGFVFSVILLAVGAAIALAAVFTRAHPTDRAAPDTF